MAQLNITLNQEEIQALLLEDQGEAFKKILQSSLNRIPQTESAEQLKAEPYKRSEEGTDSRNGSRDRDLNTRIGKITLHTFHGTGMSHSRRLSSKTTLAARRHLLPAWRKWSSTACPPGRFRGSWKRSAAPRSPNLRCLRSAKIWTKP